MIPIPSDHKMRPTGSLRRAVRLALGAGAVSMLFAVPVRSEGAFPVEFELSSLLPGNGGDGSSGTRFTISIDDERIGNDANSAGDVNGDGIDDLIIGADRHSGGTCRAYLVFGRSGGFGAEFSLDSLFPEHGGDGSLGVVLEGFNDPVQVGTGVNSIGDINGDGIDDVAVGVFGADSDHDGQTGETYVLYGRTTGFDPILDVADLWPANGGDGSAGAVVEGISGTPFAIAGGDVNGDDIDDLLLGYAYPRCCPGEAYVLFGKDGGLPANIELQTLMPENGGDGTDGFVILAPFGEFDALGGTMVAEDVNGDGIADVLVSATGWYSIGSAYAIYGRPDGMPPLFETRSLHDGDGSNGVRFVGINSGDTTGNIDAVGDFNGDGLPDLLIGAPTADVNGDRSGQAYIIFGGAGPYPGQFELFDLTLWGGGDGTAGVVLNGLREYELFGVSVRGAGDLNGDGFADVVIGSDRRSCDEVTEPGQVFVLYGRDEGMPAVVEVADFLPESGADGTDGFFIRGVDPCDRIGEGPTRAGDVNGDGVDDLLIPSVGNVVEAGEVFLLYGRGNDIDVDGIVNSADNCTHHANPDQTDSDEDGFGNRCDPDFDNDGVVNFVDLGTMRVRFFSDDPLVDLDSSGSVDFADLAILKEFLYLPPGPSGLIARRAEAQDYE